MSLFNVISSNSASIKCKSEEALHSLKSYPVNLRIRRLKNSFDWTFHVYSHCIHGLRKKMAVIAKNSTSAVFCILHTYILSYLCVSDKYQSAKICRWKRKMEYRNNEKL